MIKNTKPCYECLAREHNYQGGKEMLDDLYKDHTPKEIGEMLGVTGSSITERLHFYGIKMRPKGTAGRIK